MRTTTCGTTRMARRSQRHEEQREGDAVGRLGREREQQAADRRAHDGRPLVDDRPQRERARQQLPADEHLRQGACHGERQRSGDAVGTGQHEKRPQLVCARGADEDERRRDHGQEHDRDRQHEPTRDPVGELAGRQGQHEQRRELEQPDQPEVERLVVDAVDLPADSDRDHLAAEVHRAHGDDEDAEVAALHRGRQSLSHAGESGHRRILPRRLVRSSPLRSNGC